MLWDPWIKGFVARLLDGLEAIKHKIPIFIAITTLNLILTHVSVDQILIAH
jgi:hypothetical protein